MKIVYILGAGATKAIYSQALLNDEILPSILKLGVTKKIVISPVQSSLATRIGRIKRFIADFYGGQDVDLMRFEGVANAIQRSAFDEANELLAEQAFNYADSLNLKEVINLHESGMESKVDQALENARVLKAHRFLSEVGDLPRIEDVLNLIELGIKENHPVGTWTIERLRQVKEDVIFAIARVIDDRVKNPASSDIDSDLLTYFLGSLGSEDAVISLNYDTVIDEHIIAHFSTVNYHARVRNRITGRLGDIEQFTLAEPITPPLIKLHGSLNWMFCPTCKELDIALPEGENLLHQLKDPRSGLSKCPECGSYYEPLIITPSYLKIYDDNPIIGELWRNAERTIANADEIIFVGFSLPDADIVLRSMLSRALYKNRLRRSHESVYRQYQLLVVDYVVPGKTESEVSARATRTRYERLCGKLNDANYIIGGFAEYLRRLRAQQTLYSS